MTPRPTPTDPATRFCDLIVRWLLNEDISLGMLIEQLQDIFRISDLTDIARITLALRQRGLLPLDYRLKYRFTNTGAELDEASIRKLILMWRKQSRGQKQSSAQKQGQKEEKPCVTQ